MELRIAMEPHVSQSAAARLLQQPHGQQKRQTKRPGTSLRHARRRFNRIVEQHCVANTAYGPVVKHFDIDLSDGGQMQVEYLCPFAWMHYLCVQCSAWAQFLSRMCGQGSPGQDMRDGQGSPGQDLRGSVCIYSDDVMPGNVLRPDKGRSFLALYWGIVELPDWWRSRGRFWQTLLFMPTINQLLYALGKLGISCESVDQFACVLPRSHTKLKKTFFADLLVKHTKQTKPSQV